MPTPPHTHSHPLIPVEWTHFRRPCDMLRLTNCVSKNTTLIEPSPHPLPLQENTIQQQVEKPHKKIYTQSLRFFSPLIMKTWHNYVLKPFQFFNKKKPIRRNPICFFLLFSFSIYYRPWCDLVTVNTQATIYITLHSTCLHGVHNTSRPWEISHPYTLYVCCFEV